MKSVNFSIVIPAYNAGSTLDETLESLSVQTFPKWEAIIVDDGSTDNTATIAYRWAERDNRFRVIQQNNGGESAARNSAIRGARNKWLVFLDSDDWLSREYLERMAKQIVENPGLDAVVCGCVRVTPSGEYGPIAIYTQSLLNKPFPEFVRDCPFAPLNCVIRRSLVQEIGEFDTSLVTCADWDFWQRVARTGARFGNIPEVLAYYRMRPGSASSNAECILADGLTVIRRGHNRDPRVLFPNPDYTDGLPSDNISNEFYRHCLWPASHKIVRGEDARPLLELIGEERAPNLDPLEVATSLFECIPLAANTTAKDWPLLWPNVVEQLRAFLSALEAKSGAVELEKLTFLHIEPLIIDMIYTKQPITFGSTHRVRINVEQPIADVTVPEGVEQLSCLVDFKKQNIGSVQLPVHVCIVTGKAITEAIVANLALQIMLKYFRMELPQGSNLRSKLHELIWVKQPLRIVTKLAGLTWPMIRWQLNEGVLRDPRLFLRFIRLMLDNITFRIALQIVWTRPECRENHIKEFLWNISRQLIREDNLVSPNLS